MKKLFALTLIVFMILSFGIETSNAQDNVRFGVDSFILGSEFHIAEELGYFEENNIDADILTFSYGIDTVDAILTGETDIGVALDFAGLTRLPAGELRIVAADIEPEPGFHQLAVKENIESPKDLKGTSMAIAEGTLQHYVTLNYLDVNGVPRKNVDLSSFTSAFEIVGALEAGHVDAGWIWGEAIEEVEKMDDVNIIAGDGAAEIESVGTIMASRELTENSPETVKNILSALINATDWMEENLEEASEIIAERTNAPQEEVYNQMQTQNYTIEFRKTHKITLNELANFMYDENILDEELNLDDYLIIDLLNEVNENRVDM